MNKHIGTGVQLAVNGAMALASLTPVGALAMDATQSSDQTAAQINQASLTSVEQSYLQIPRMCKARSAAFDPIIVGREQASRSAAAVHAALDFAAQATA